MEQLTILCVLFCSVASNISSLTFCRYSTPLHDAVCCGRQEVVRILLERGANVNEIDYKDMTPLKLAIRSESVLQRRTFIRPLGHFAFLCPRYGQDEIAEMLSAKGAKEKVDVPLKKTSVVGEVDPPWVRRVSRREQAA